MAEKPSGTTALQWVERLLEPSASEGTMIEAVSPYLLYNVEFCILPVSPRLRCFHQVTTLTWWTREL